MQIQAVNLQYTRVHLIMDTPSFLGYMTIKFNNLRKVFPVRLATN